jgi:hypothetical protein
MLMRLRICDQAAEQTQRAAELAVNDARRRPFGPCAARASSAEGLAGFCHAGFRGVVNPGNRRPCLSWPDPSRRGCPPPSSWHC